MVYVRNLRKIRTKGSKTGIYGSCILHVDAFFEKKNFHEAKNKRKQLNCPGYSIAIKIKSNYSSK